MSLVRRRESAASASVIISRYESCQPVASRTRWSEPMTAPLSASPSWSPSEGFDKEQGFSDPTGARIPIPANEHASFFRAAALALMRCVGAASRAAPREELPNPWAALGSSGLPDIYKPRRIGGAEIPRGKTPPSSRVVTYEISESWGQNWLDKNGGNGVQFPG